MGCDIHMFVEANEAARDAGWSSWNMKIDHPSLWDIECHDGEDHIEISIYSKRPGVMEVAGSRHYGLFQRLAGVRADREFTPKIPPRGLPDNVSRPVGIYCASWGGDGHSHSWLTLQELDELMVNQFSEVVPMMDEMRKLHDDPTQVRIVFWFDN